MRETENTAYARKREFLLCTDICGSALDTLRSRQEQAYCPALVEVFELEEHAQEARRAWMSVALESRLRGRIAFANPGVSGSSFTVLATLIQALGDEDALGRFADNVRGYELSIRIFDSGPII